MVAFVVFPLSDHVTLHFFAREKGHVVAVEAVWSQQLEVAGDLDLSHVAHKGTVALLPLLWVTPHAPQVIQDLAGPHYKKDLVP